METLAIAALEALFADICIVGAGPAAIACALHLIGCGLKIILVETGGTLYDPQAQEIGRTETGLRFGTVDCAYNTRQFGGNANAWLVDTGRSYRGVRLAPLTPADFEPRPGLADTGWPINFSDLNAFYRQAPRIFGLPSDSFDVEPWSGPDTPDLPVADGSVDTAMYMFGDGQVFTNDHRATLEKSEDVRILTHHTVTSLETPSGDTRVRSAVAVDRDGRKRRIVADQFILAGGGLGSTQLLLSSIADASLSIGPAAENVGRYFIDHPLLNGGEFFPSDRKLIDRMALYDLRTIGAAPVMGHLKLSDAALRRESLLNMSMIFLPRRNGWQVSETMNARQVAGFQAAIRLRGAIRDRRLPAAWDLVAGAVGIDGIARRLFSRVVSPTANLARGGWSKLPARQRARFDRFQILHVAEQAPHRDNRVMLGSERDATGLRRLTIDWQWHQSDQDKSMRGQQIFADALAGAGLGTFAIHKDGAGPSVVSSTTGHWMGLTRMSRSARDGVVDTDCRVHGTDNLYIASSSVFPTGGYANPTLTVVAISLRIADRLRRLYRRDLTEDAGKAIEATTDGQRADPQTSYSPKSHLDAGLPRPFSDD